MTKVSDLMASYGGRQSAADADTIVSSMGGRQGTPTPTTFRTVISTRNGMPSMGSTGTPRAGSNASTSIRQSRTNNSPFTATNLAVRFVGGGYNALLAYFSQGGPANITASLQIGGTRYQLFQGGNINIVVPADGFLDTDIITNAGVPLQLIGGTTAILRIFNNQAIGNYGLAGNNGGSTLAALAEYNNFTGSTTDFTMSGDATGGTNGGGVNGWLIGDMPIGAKSALTIDDSKGRGIMEQNSTGVNLDYIAAYTSDAQGNSGLWDRLHASVGMNGLNLSLPTSSLLGNGSTTGWTHGDLSKLLSWMAGLKFTHLEYGLWQNDGAAVAAMQAGYVTLHGIFSPFLLPGGIVTAREMSPSNSDSVAVTGTTYSGTTGVDSITNAQAVALQAAVSAGLTVIKKAGANQAGFVGVFPIVSVDTTANTVSYTVASGLTTPTTFGTMSSLFSTTVFQTATNDNNRAGVNAAVNALTLVPNQSKVVSMLSAEQVAVSGGFGWRVDGTRQKYVADGVHETAAMYILDVAANSGYS